MTTNQKQLAKLQQHAKDLAEQIKQLQEQINNTQPTSGLLGRWATNRDGKRVLITTDRPVDGWIETTYVNPDGTTREKAEQLDSLSFPGQTTCPQDVPVGEAWLINADDGYDSTTNAPAVKEHTGLWITGENPKGAENSWTDHEVTLITPLIPARPQDAPETVTTEEEYRVLPEGTIVALRGVPPWTRGTREWIQEGDAVDSLRLAGTTRHILRRGWGE